MGVYLIFIYICLALGALMVAAGLIDYRVMRRKSKGKHMK